ncbi:ABC transporter permease [Thiohalorhabdus sp. Cl-TMA]|uniref:ABC transporter permease n=1 Tax=Thiohalorhabdus methylotrophus TaxID=3242694 RepID=A0ABV4TSD9_9GAMM
MSPVRLLFRALVWGPLSGRPMQAVGMVLAIALGVAMVAAIHWVNASALYSFQQGISALSGRAGTTVQPTSRALDQGLLPRIRAMPEVAAAFPALRMEVPTGPERALPVLGVDLLRDAAVRGSYLPDLGGTGIEFDDLLGKGAVLLGREAARRLDKGPGDSLRVQIGTEPVVLRVAGLLPDEAFWSDGAVMDIATAQWTFNRLGELDRIDVVLRSPDLRAAFAERLERVAGEGVRLSRPGLEAHRLDAMTRAYRTNLNVLALVGLLTAAFLVYSLLTLSMRRRRTQFAVLRVLGMERGRLAGWLLGEGLVLGLLGGLLGLVLGLTLAWIGVEALGGDLGAGYFSDIRARLHTQWWDMLGLGALGVLAAVLGTLAPVVDNVRGAGEAAMRRGGAEERRGPGPVIRLGLAALALTTAGALSRFPAWNGLPVAGYVAILLVLGAGLLLAPPALRLFARGLPVSRRAVAALVARSQLLGAPRRAALAVSAALVSFALLVAMSTMIHSFRGSVVAWLDQILAADLYVRSGPGGQTTYISKATWKAIAGWRDVRHLDPFRRAELDWAPGGASGPDAPVEITARRLDLAETRNAIEVMRGRWPQPGEDRAVLVSEVFARKYGTEVGDVLRVPLGGELRRLEVAGVWRDYSYQWGHLLMERATYAALAGDRRVDQIALYLAPRADKEAVRKRLEETFADAPALEIADAGEIRGTSLEIFDRSFAVTYVLVVVAVGVGLVGTLQSLAVQAIERRGELAMLRFLGFRVADVARAQAYEAGLTGAFGGILGMAVGAAVAWLLVKVVNDQSFLWSLPVTFPWGLLAVAWLGLATATAAGGWLLGRAQGRRDPTQAVGEE